MFCYVTIVWFVIWLLYDLSCDYCMICHVTIVWFVMWQCMICHLTISYFLLIKKRFKKSIYRKMIVVGNWATQDHFSKVSINNFSGIKNMKKGYIEITEKITEITEKICLETLRSVLGRSISHYSSISVTHILLKWNLVQLYLS